MSLTQQMITHHLFSEEQTALEPLSALNRRHIQGLKK